MAYSDEQIRKDVVDQLHWDGRVEAADIRVMVRQGEVTLSGTVPTFLAREAARSDTWKVPGVRVVRDELDVRRPAELPADRVTERNVRRLLQWGLAGAEIRVSVQAGTVFLEGAVDAAWKKERAEELASYVVGARAIVSRIGVDPGGTAP